MRPVFIDGIEAQRILDTALCLADWCAGDEWGRVDATPSPMVRTSQVNSRSAQRDNEEGAMPNKKTAAKKTRRAAQPRNLKPSKIKVEAIRGGGVRGESTDAKHKDW